MMEQVEDGVGVCGLIRDRAAELIECGDGLSRWGNGAGIYAVQVFNGGVFGVFEELCAIVRRNKAGQT